MTLRNALLPTCGRPNARTLIHLITAFGQWSRNESNKRQYRTWQSCSRGDEHWACGLAYRSGRAYRRMQCLSATLCWKSAKCRDGAVEKRLDACVRAQWVITLCAKLSGAVYCNRSCLFACVCVCVCLWVCYHDNSKLRTGSVGEGSDHPQLIKFWPSCAPGKGICGGCGNFWLLLTMPNHHAVLASLS